MRILDTQNRILPALVDHGLDHELDDLIVLSIDDFLSSPLQSRYEPLLIDVASISHLKLDDQLLAMINTHPCAVLFIPTPVEKSCQEWMESLLLLSDKVISVQQLPLGKTSRDFLRNQLLYLWRQKKERISYKEKMIRFSHEIDELVKTAQQEMLKAKKVHESVVPKRVEEIKGVTLMSKYSVGSGSGTEYFDVIRGQTQSHLVMVHTNSYLASSCLMGLLNKYKGSSVGIDHRLFLQEAELELKAINSNKKKSVEVELFLMKLDHLTLQCEGFSFGSFELFGQLEDYTLPQVEKFDLSKQNLATFNFQLKRGEKVIVFSPGFIFNWCEGRGLAKVQDFISEQKGLSNSDLLTELFFQLKKDSSGEFLAKDATTVVMEVNRHAIQKV
jgi:hypothetical protein